MRLYLGLSLIFVIAGSIALLNNPALALTDTERYDSGYTYGCSDGKTGGHPYLNTHPTHTTSFMNGYNAGYSDCSGSVSTGQQEGPRFNWGALCKKIQGFIIEPCNTLTTPDGYTLTQEGKRVVACFVAGGLAIIYLTPAELLAARQLGPAIGCG